MDYRESQSHSKWALLDIPHNFAFQNITGGATSLHAYSLDRKSFKC
jgi:hypothetical protein